MFHVVLMGIMVVNLVVEPFHTGRGKQSIGLISHFSSCA